jgi:hypothetical protein|tara:strand:+ start:986 stop:1159 length:174 start_codon:yes stop_codon:yes gene_type:complete
MTKQQIIHIEVPVSIVITAPTQEDAFDILDRLNKEEILTLALHNVPFEVAKTSRQLQ